MIWFILQSASVSDLISVFDTATKSLLSDNKIKHTNEFGKSLIIASP